MPRPSKSRRICRVPSCDRFGPMNGAADAAVMMTVDEYETIRLIDLEGMIQEQCAEQMDIARTTVQAIYSSARLKLARCLVNQMELTIEGGDYVLCDGNSAQCRRFCHRRKNDSPSNIHTVQERSISMKIAVTYENGQIFQHFGHTAQFKIYDIEDNKVVSAMVMDTLGSGHGALAGFLQALGVDTLICGGIGGGAQVALREAGILLYGGVSGDADAAVNALLDGSLLFNPNVVCNHHGEHHHHEGGCGDHGCGNHDDHACGGHCHH